LLAVAVLSIQSPGRWLKWAYNSFCLGLLFFSGSLYLITYIRVHGDGNVKWVGPITPLGGLLLILGWIFLLLAAFDKGHSERKS
jgi:uncharacterized membrane protein YgdD (TMEM256/DUF423 family)